MFSFPASSIYLPDMRPKSILRGAFAAFIPYSFRLGKTFRKTTAFLHDSGSWTKDQIYTYQSAQLRELVQHAYRHVPWYRKKYEADRIDIDNIKEPKDLFRLPLISKDDLRNSPADEFCAVNLSKDNLVKVMSGGTTGSPTAFFHLKGYSDGIFNAYRVDAWRAAGYSPALRALDLTWAFSGSPFRFNPYMNWLSYSIAALNPATFAEDFKKIRAFRPRFIIGYPSSVAMFAELLREHGVDCFVPDGIITGSEMLYPYQRDAIAKTLRCRIFEWYGLSELAGFGGYCKASDDYHFFPQAGCVELITAAGKAATQEGEEGEIVLTGFHTLATPFIRYRTGDRGIFGATCCSACGKNYITIKKIIGREQDYLYSQEYKVPLSALNCHANIFEHVWKYQFHQREPGRVALKLAAKPGFGDSDLKVIDDWLRRKLGEGFQWQIVRVGDIPATARGKHKFLVQEIDENRRSSSDGKL